jgi:hypothetical protein
MFCPLWSVSTSQRTSGWRHPRHMLPGPCLNLASHGMVYKTVFQIITSLCVEYARLKAAAVRERLLYNILVAYRYRYYPEPTEIKMSFHFYSTWYPSI